MYTSGTYIVEQFGERFNFGTSGTNLLTIAQSNNIISRSTNMIDYELVNIYGTAPISIGTTGTIVWTNYDNLFGTNKYGTLNVPSVITDICTDISVGLMYKNLWLTISEQEKIWADEVYNRGISLLNKLKLGEIDAVPFAGTKNTGNLPVFANTYGEVYGEIFTLDGTNAHYLENRNVVKVDLRVYGTALDNPTSYTEGTDFEVYYYKDINVGTNYGVIRGIGTGTIEVRVDYKYHIDRVMKLNDTLKWGEGRIESRG